MRSRTARSTANTHREPRMEPRDRSRGRNAGRSRRSARKLDASKPRQAGIVDGPASRRTTEAFRKSGDGLGARLRKKPPSGNLAANGLQRRRGERGAAGKDRSRRPRSRVGPLREWWRVEQAEPPDGRHKSRRRKPPSQEVDQSSGAKPHRVTAGPDAGDSLARMGRRSWTMTPFPVQRRTTIGQAFGGPREFADRPFDQAAHRTAGPAEPRRSRHATCPPRPPPSASGNAQPLLSPRGWKTQRIRARRRIRAASPADRPSQEAGESGHHPKQAEQQ